MQTFWKDIQFAVRTLAKNPGFAVLAIVTLALGMAVNTTIFSVINGIMLCPLSGHLDQARPAFADGYGQA
jgi:hypothetical protein